MTDQEINKKLAEWAGFTVKNYPEPRVYLGEKAWFSPDGLFFSGLINFIDFTNDLNACFKWLVPKLQRWEMGNNPAGDILAIVASKETVYPCEFISKEPARALCGAIFELIESDNG